MKYTVWGGRGSHPTPLSSQAIQSKIATVLQRARPSDLESAEARERFMASLPPWLFGTTSGNTACIQLELDDKRQLIFDAGSGLIPYAARQLHRSDPPTEYHLFFTHFHYDHIQGLPFFVPAYNPSVRINFYSPLPHLREKLVSQMRDPYFPIRMDERMSGNFAFHTIGDEGLDVYGARISARELNHPGKAFGYRVEHNGRVFAYVTDVELLESDFEKSADNSRFFGDVDVLILDTQYTLGEAIEKFTWGHSSFSLGVDFASAWGTKSLVLFHHEPKYDDKKLFQNLQSARWYANRIGNEALDVSLAREGITLDV